MTPAELHEMIVVSVVAVIAGLVMLCVWFLGMAKSRRDDDVWSVVSDLGSIFGFIGIGVPAIIWPLYGIYLVVESVL